MPVQLPDQNIIAGTGHRPPKLGGYSEEVHLRLVALAKRYLEREQPDQVVSGGALGWDTALAQAAIELGIPLLLALPFEGFHTKWPHSSRTLFEGIRESATKVVYVCKPGYAAWKMQARNVYMAQACTKLVALWNGSDGGTANCIKYAQSISKRFDNLWEEWASNEDVC